MSAIFSPTSVPSTLYLFFRVRSCRYNLDMKILLLHVNGLHLGYLGCYGNDWVQTPNLDRLAAEGIVFDQHIADCPRLSTKSAFTGQLCFPSADGQEAKNEAPSLPAILDSHGIPHTVLNGQGKSAKNLVDS